MSKNNYSKKEGVAFKKNKLLSTYAKIVFREIGSEAELQPSATSN